MIIQEAIKLTMKSFSDTEYLFGGTSIKREAGKDISVTCTLEDFKWYCKSILDFGS